MEMHVVRYLEEIWPTDDIPEITLAEKQWAQLEPEVISLAKIFLNCLQKPQDPIKPQDPDTTWLTFFGIP